MGTADFLPVAKSAYCKWMVQGHLQLGIDVGNRQTYLAGVSPPPDKRLSTDSSIQPQRQQCQNHATGKDAA